MESIKKSATTNESENTKSKAMTTNEIVTLISSQLRSKEEVLGSREGEVLGFISWNYKHDSQKAGTDGTKKTISIIKEAL
jgi:hypothetical protein